MRCLSQSLSVTARWRVTFILPPPWAAYHGVRRVLEIQTTYSFARKTLEVSFGRHFLIFAEDVSSWSRRRWRTLLQEQPSWFGRHFFAEDGSSWFGRHFFAEDGSSWFGRHRFAESGSSWSRRRIRLQEKPSWFGRHLLAEDESSWSRRRTLLQEKPSWFGRQLLAEDGSSWSGRRSLLQEKLSRLVGISSAFSTLWAKSPLRTGLCMPP